MLTTVYIKDSRGREFATNVEAETHEAAAAKACEFFRDSFWKGPKPAPGVTLRVCPIGGVQRYVTLPA